MPPEETPTGSFSSPSGEPQAKPGGKEETTAEAPLEYPLEGTQFWVIGGDGRKYGPTDRPGLQVWFEEGRIAPDMMVANELNGSAIARRLFLFKEPEAPEPYRIEEEREEPPILDEFEEGFHQHFHLGVPETEESKPGMAAYYAAQSLAVVALIVGFLFGPVGVALQPFAIYLAHSAEKQGIAEAQTPRIIATIGLVLSLILTVVVIGALLEAFG